MMTPEYLWVFDGNRRVYRDGQSGPVWRAHWVKIPIVKESRTHYTMAHGVRMFGRVVVRVEKATLPNSRVFALSTDRIDELDWVQTHRYKIKRAVELCDEPVILRAIARAVGYESEEAK